MSPLHTQLNFTYPIALVNYHTCTPIEQAFSPSLQLAVTYQQHSCTGSPLVASHWAPPLTLSRHTPPGLQPASRAVSYIRRTVDQLQPICHYGVWSCLYSAVQTRLDYWLQHLPPAVMHDACTRVDTAVIEAVERITYRGALASVEVQARFQLPIRRRGCGIRSRRWLALSAFCGPG